MRDAASPVCHSKRLYIIWAKHRRRKAAAKAHVRLNFQNLLPAFVVVDTAAEHDNVRARELCADLKDGEIAWFDKGYVDFEPLRDWDGRGIQWVTRAKENLAYEVVKPMPQSKDEKILRDEIIVPRDPNKPAPELMRTYVLLRYLSYLSQRAHSFTRRFTLLRAAQWQKLDLLKLLGAYGTAGGSFRHLAPPEQAYLPGLL